MEPLTKACWNQLQALVNVLLTHSSLQILRFIHQVIESLSSGQDPLHVLRHDVLHSIYLISQGLHLVLWLHLYSHSSLKTDDRTQLSQEKDILILHKVFSSNFLKGGTKETNSPYDIKDFSGFW